MTQTITFRFPDGPVTDAMQAVGLAEDTAYGVGDILEAAQCLWEAIISAPSGRFPDFEKYGSLHGAVGLRYALRDEKILAACSIGIHLAREAGFEWAYDWDFCPWFITHCLTVAESEVRLVSDWLDRCKNKAG